MEALHVALSRIAEVVDLVSLLILLIGAAKFIYTYARVELRRLGVTACTDEVQSARRLLGSYILVALEFMIVSDIIGSVVTRSLESLGFLAGIVLLRTAIGYFLEQELESRRGAEGSA